MTRGTLPPPIVPYLCSFEPRTRLRVRSSFKPTSVSCEPLAERSSRGWLKSRAFPSLYSYQIELAQTYAEVYELPPNLTPLLAGRTAKQYRDLVTSSILGGHDPENVVLLEIDPFNQKTLADFLLTERCAGLRRSTSQKFRSKAAP